MNKCKTVQKPKIIHKWRISVEGKWVVVSLKYKYREHTGRSYHFTPSKYKATVFDKDECGLWLSILLNEHWVGVKAEQIQ